MIKLKFAGFTFVTTFILAASQFLSAQTIQQYSIACTNGNYSACNSVGVHYDQLNQPARAFNYLKAACDGGYSLGCSNLGELYFDGRGVGKDSQTAVLLFSRGCTAGVTGGCAGICVVGLASGALLDANQLTYCENQINTSCRNGNPWMCEKQEELFIAINNNTQSCQGQSLAQSKALVEDVWVLMLSVVSNVGVFDDPITIYNRYINGLARLESHAQQLPRSCQILIKQWGDIMGQGPQSGGTQCAGGVCCDSSGCY